MSDTKRFQALRSSDYSISDVSCGNCIFAGIVEGTMETLECRRNPPTVLQEYETGIWPHVDARKFCGEFAEFMEPEDDADDDSEEISSDPDFLRAFVAQQEEKHRERVDSYRVPVAPK